MKISTNYLIDENYLSAHIDSITEYNFEKICIPEISEKTELLDLLNSVSKHKLNENQPEKLAIVLCKIIEGFSYHHNYPSQSKSDYYSSNIFQIAYELSEQLNKSKTLALFQSFQHSLHSQLFFKNSKMSQYFISFYTLFASKEFKDYFLNTHMPYIINKEDPHHRVHMMVNRISKGRDFLKDNPCFFNNKYIYGDLKNQSILELSNIQYMNILMEHYNFIKKNIKYSSETNDIINGFIININSIPVTELNNDIILSFNILISFLNNIDSSFAFTTHFNDKIYSKDRELCMLSKFENSILNDEDKDKYLMIKNSYIEKQKINKVLKNEVSNEYRKRL